MQHCPAIFILLLACLVLTQACFIRNCPRGGKKRSAGQENHSHHQCPTCDGGRGRCVDSNICCSPSIGCEINGPHSLPCRSEDSDMKPCSVKGKSCGVDGVCGSNGVCCVDGTCSVDSSCKLDHSMNDFISMIKRHIQRMERMRD